MENKETPIQLPDGEPSPFDIFFHAASIIIGSLSIIIGFGFGIKSCIDKPSGIDGGSLSASIKLFVWGWLIGGVKCWLIGVAFLAVLMLIKALLSGKPPHIDP